MREALSQLNKSSIAKATGIPHGRLRKYSSGQIGSLTSAEAALIHNYLLELAKVFEIGGVDKNESSKL